MSWQALLDDTGRVVTVNNWENQVGVPCEPDTPLGYIWNGSAFVRDIEDVKRELQAAVQGHLDAAVRVRHYDGILSCSSYINSSDPIFAAHAAVASAWRDAVWRHCYNVLADFEAGNRPAPTAEQLIAELPALVW